MNTYRWDDVLIALLGAIPATLIALATLFASLGNRHRLNALHIAINSRLTELLRATASASHSEGLIAGRRYTDPLINEDKKP